VAVHDVRTKVTGKCIISTSLLINLCAESSDQTSEISPANHLSNVLPFSTLHDRHCITSGNEWTVGLLVAVFDCQHGAVTEQLFDV